MEFCAPARLERQRGVGAAHHAAGQEVRLSDEVGDEAATGTLVQVLGRAQLLQPAAVHDADAVRQRQRLLLVVRDVHDGDAQPALDLLDLCLHVLAQLAVQRAQWLVHEHDRRIEHERARQRHPLLLAPGELARVAVFEAGQAHDLQRLANALLGLHARHLAHPEREADVGGDGHVGEQRVVLEDEADVAPVRRLAGQLAVVGVDLAKILQHEARDDLEDRGLAGAARPQQGEELARVDGERDVVEHTAAHVGFAEALDPQGAAVTLLSHDRLAAVRGGATSGAAAGPGCRPAPAPGHGPCGPPS